MNPKSGGCLGMPVLSRQHINPQIRFYDFADLLARGNGGRRRYCREARREIAFRKPMVNHKSLLVYGLFVIHAFGTKGLFGHW